MKKIFSFAAIVLTIVALSGCVNPFINTTNESGLSSLEGNDSSLMNVSSDNQVMIDEYQDWNSFTNSTGAYGFKYPNSWVALVNKYDNKNSLFGESATNESGDGGVEIINYSGTVTEYLNYMEQNAEVTYTNKENIIINGISGVQVKYSGFPTSGNAVILKNGEKIYNIFIKGNNLEDIKLFNKLVASFYFSD